jgi:hypothetical protein
VADGHGTATPSAPAGGQGRRAVLRVGAAAAAGLALGGRYLGASAGGYLQPPGSDYVQPRVTSVALLEVAYASGYRGAAARGTPAADADQPAAVSSR